MWKIFIINTHRNRLHSIEKHLVFSPCASQHAPTQDTRIHRKKVLHFFLFKEAAQELVRGPASVTTRCPPCEESSTFDRQRFTEISLKLVEKWTREGAEKKSAKNRKHNDNRSESEM